MWKKVGVGLLIVYFTIASYHSVRTEIRYWFGYIDACGADK